MGPGVTKCKPLLGSLIVPGALPEVEPTLPETPPGKLPMYHRVVRTFPCPSGDSLSQELGISECD